MTGRMPPDILPEATVTQILCAARNEWLLQPEQVPSYAEGQVRRGPLVSGAHFDGHDSTSHATIGQLATCPADVATEAAQGPRVIAGARVGRARRRAHWIAARCQRSEAAKTNRQEVEQARA